MFFTIEIIQWK